MTHTFTHTAAQKGRKRLPEAQQRSERVMFRLSAAERAALDARATSAGLTFTDYARGVLLEAQTALPTRQHVEDVRTSPEHAAFVVQLIRLGNNLNQIARAVNQDRASFSDMAALGSLVARIDALLQEHGA